MNNDIAMRLFMGWGSLELLLFFGVCFLPEELSEKFFTLFMIMAGIFMFVVVGTLVTCGVYYAFTGVDILPR